MPANSLALRAIRALCDTATAVAAYNQRATPSASAIPARLQYDSVNRASEIARVALGDGTPAAFVFAAMIRDIRWLMMIDRAELRRVTTHDAPTDDDLAALLRDVTEAADNAVTHRVIIGTTAAGMSFGANEPRGR